MCSLNISDVFLAYTYYELVITLVNLLNVPQSPRALRAHRLISNLAYPQPRSSGVLRRETEIPEPFFHRAPRPITEPGPGSGTSLPSQAPHHEHPRRIINAHGGRKTPATERKKNRKTARTTTLTHSLITRKNALLRIRQGGRVDFEGSSSLVSTHLPICVPQL